ncbi:MAG: hypothetical protein ACOC2L_02130 [Candidatus Sumerlaeota bacterium]
MALKETLTSVLTKSDSGIDSPVLDLEETPGGKVGGFIISPSFAGMPQIERQNLLWDYLDHALSQEQLTRIVSLVTVTPDEAEEE